MSAKSKTFILTAVDGTPVQREVNLGQGNTGNFNYLVQRLTGSATADIKAYQHSDSNPTLANTIQLGATKALGDTAQLTLGLAADVAKYCDRVTVWLDPSAAGSWQITLVAA